MENEKQRMKKISIDNTGKIQIKKDYIKGIDSGLTDIWQEYTLFSKCIGGDSSDNIFPAYHLASAKSSLKKGLKKLE